MKSTLSDRLWSNILRVPTRAFLTKPAEVFTYSDLSASIERNCGLFDIVGLSSGETVLIVTSDDWVAVTLWIAALLDGKVPTIVASDAGTERLSGIVALAEPKLILTDTARNAEAWAKSSNAAVHNPTSLSQGLDAVRSPCLDQPVSELAYLLFTSGTTSEPKGAMLSHGNLESQLISITRVFEVQASSVIYNGLVSYHTDGLIQGPILAAFAGGSLLRPEPFALNRLEKDLCWLRDMGATHLISVPTIYAMIDRYAERDDYFSRPEFHAMLTTSAPIDPELWVRLEERFGTPVINEYGMTETVAATHFAGPHPEMGGRFTIGRPVGCEAQLCDPKEGSLVLEGEVGELWVRGGNIFKGYLGKPKETAAVFSGDWFRTGDLCQITPEGDYAIVGRISTAINSGGFLIRPEEIDEALRAHPDVIEAQSVGVHHPDFGSVPVSAVVLRTPNDLASIFAFCRERLESQKVPKKIIPVEKIPRRGSGKADINALSELLQEKMAPADSPALSPNESVTQSKHQNAVLDLAAEVFGAPRDELDLSSGPDDVGGWDSYAHTMLAMEAEELFGIRIPGGEILSIGTLADLAVIVDRLNPAEDPENGFKPDLDLLEVVKPGADGGTMIAMPDLFGVPFWVNKYLPFLDNRTTIVALRPSPDMSLQHLAPSVFEYSQRFADIIAAGNLRGPVSLMGYSFGGFLAYETASDLSERHGIQAHVIILDSAVPSRFRRKKLSDIIEWHVRIWSWRFRQIKKILSPTVGGEFDMLDSPGIFPVHLSDHLENLRPTIRQFYMALTNYEPRTHTGPIVIFRALKRRGLMGASPALGWDEYVNGEIVEHNINADHWSILFDDEICPVVSETINQVLDGFESQASVEIQ